MWSGLGQLNITKAKNLWSSLEQSLDAAVGQDTETKPRFSPLNIPPPPPATSSEPELASNSGDHLLKADEQRQSVESAQVGGEARTDQESSGQGFTRARRVSKDFFETLLSSTSRALTPTLPIGGGLLGTGIDLDAEDEVLAEAPHQPLPPQQEQPPSSMVVTPPATSAAAPLTPPEVPPTDLPAATEAYLSSPAISEPFQEPDSDGHEGDTAIRNPEHNTHAEQGPLLRPPEVDGAGTVAALRSDIGPSETEIDGGEAAKVVGNAQSDDDVITGGSGEQRGENGSSPSITTELRPPVDAAPVEPLVHHCVEHAGDRASGAAEVQQAPKSSSKAPAATDMVDPAPDPSEAVPSASSNTPPSVTPIEPESDIPALQPVPPAAPPQDTGIPKELVEQMKEQYEGQMRRLQQALGHAESRVEMLEGELRKAQNLYAADDAKSRQIAALLEEGKALAFKQSEMEKTVRKARGELKSVEAERVKLAQDKEALELKVKTMTELVKRRETEATTLSQSLAAVQTVNQASSERIAKLEAELSKARDELSGSKAALEKAWNDEKELKRMITDMTAQHGTLLEEMDEDKALHKGLEGIKQEFEQREALLHATNKQLQDALTRAAFEAGLREDSLRQEVADMRKRWQDAVARTESLAADMHESTSPLLRQIKALQEEARVRAMAWTSTEEALTDRARTAETNARAAEASKAQLSHRVEGLQSRIADLELQLSTLTSRVQDLSAALKASQESESEARAHMEGLEQEAADASEAARRTAKDAKAMEAKLRRQLKDAQDALEVMRSEHQDERSRLQAELDAARRDATESHPRRRAPSTPMSMTQGSHFAWSPRRPPEALSQSSILERSLTMGSERTPQSSFALSGGDMSVLAMEKLQQALRQKEDEVAHLQQMLVNVEKTRDALTAEVAKLGKQNSLLQSSVQSVRELRQQVATLTQKNEVLLELLGEKTEEMESLQNEFVDLKKRFRHQLDALLGQKDIDLPRSSPEPQRASS